MVLFLRRKVDCIVGQADHSLCPTWDCIYGCTGSSGGWGESTLYALRLGRSLDISRDTVLFLSFLQDGSEETPVLTCAPGASPSIAKGLVPSLATPSRHSLIALLTTLACPPSSVYVSWIIPLLPLCLSDKWRNRGSGKVSNFLGCSATL